VLGAAGTLAAVGLLGYGILSGAIPLLVFLSGDPEERDRSGANENALFKEFVLKITPSAWKKAYQGDNDVERQDGDGPAKVILDLPAWQGDEARELVEPEAVVNVKSMQLATIDVPSLGPVDTCYLSLRPEPEKAVDAPPLLLIHGFDSSVLEFRYIAPQLVEAGLRVEAMEWWTGGFTARRPFVDKLERDSSATPWELIRDHQFAYWKRQLGGEKAVVLGASLGGAVAMDFAVSHPECVESLVLMDAGGESYAQPDPILTALCADPVTNLFQWRATNGMLPYPHVWAKEDLWRDSLRAYLKSGGYQRRVNRELIRQVPQSTLVLWGEEDDVLPPSDAAKYQADLPDCVGVRMIPNAQHAPALENPDFVANALIEFAKSRGPVAQPAAPVPSAA